MGMGTIVLQYFGLFGLPFFVAISVRVRAPMSMMIQRGEDVGDVVAALQNRDDSTTSCGFCFEGYRHETNAVHV